MSTVSDFARKWSFRQSQIRKAKRPRSAFAMEPLESRIMPAVTAMFSPDAALLTVIGDSLDNTITLNRNAAGNILVNGG
ncbi:MAG TPA: hypothetical protein VFR05_02565, partial [Terriglobia bacterium]|nr:hypothetical protein [Terriglobia bacterium]